MISYFDKVRPTFFEHWPPALRALSLETASVPLDRDDIMSLESLAAEYLCGFGTLTEMLEAGGWRSVLDAWTRYAPDGDDP